MANASLLSDYSDCRFEFRDRLNNKAAIDNGTIPLRVEYLNGSDGVATIDNIRPATTGSLVDEFLCDLNTHEAGIMEATLIADSDITPENETELRVNVTVAVMPGQATTIGFSLGTEVPKEAPVPEPIPA